MVGGSIPPATTNLLSTANRPQPEQGTNQNPQAHSIISQNQGITLKRAVDSFILNCKVEGKAQGTIDCYADKLKGFLWYTRTYSWPDNIALITTQHLREFLVYVRETKERWGSDCPRAKMLVNSTTVQKYYRALSVMLNWLITEEILTINPLDRIKAPRAEKKVVKGLANTEVSTLLSFMGNNFEGKRNKAMILVLVDCGLRLGELLNTRLSDINMEEQTIKVDGKTGERVVRFGSTTARALMRYIMSCQNINGHTDRLWMIKEGTPLKAYAVETLFRALSRKTGISVHPHLLRHTCATLWLKNGGDSLMLQRLLGHTTLMMTNRYCQAVGCFDAMESHKLYDPVDRLTIM